MNIRAEEVMCKVCGKKTDENRYVCEDCEPAVRYGARTVMKEVKKRVNEIFAEMDKDVER